MTVKAITPYLFFDGDAERAIEHYQQALDADVEGLMRWGDHGAECPDGMKGRVMHAALKIGAATVMLSDSPSNTRIDAPKERAVSIAISVDDPAEMSTQFDALASQGTVVEKIHDAFWGDEFGVVRDVFGVTWMFTCPTKKD